MARTLTKSAIFGSETGGQAWDDGIATHSPTITGIQKVDIRHGNQVDGIKVTYRLANGGTFIASNHGGTGGLLSSFELASDEAIIEFKGKTNGVLVDQVTFVIMNAGGGIREVGPYGKTGQTPFSVNGYIVGFFGRAGNLLDGLGTYFLPPLNKIPAEGGTGGTVFVDPVFTNPIVNVKNIRIRSGNQVDSLEVAYQLLGGGILQGAKHGGSGGSEKTVQLADGEILVSMTGKTNGVLVDQITLTSLKPDGSSGVYGPFGRTGRREFNMDGKIVGFHGSAGNLLDALGVFTVNQN